MANKHDIDRNALQLFGDQAKQGYDWWWHSFTGEDEETGETRPFFIEFFTCNPAYGGKYPVFSRTGDDPDKVERPSYVMIKAGAWCGEDRAQLHRFFGWQKAYVERKKPIAIHAFNCHMTETATSGSVIIDADYVNNHPGCMSDVGIMSWKLKINKRIAFNVGYGASKLMRRWQLFEMFWHAEGMKTEYDGEVMYNGRLYRVRPETCYGYADKNWGKGFTTPWVWLSSCHLTSELTGKELKNSVFDIGGGRPKIGSWVLNRKLLADFWYEGKDYEFNFSKFWTGCRTKFRCYETETQVVWHVEQRTWFHRMVTDITCEKKDMLLVRYEDPNGERRHRRLWNGGNGVGTVSLYRGSHLIDRMHAENVGCEYGEYDTTEPYKELR